MNQGEIAAAVLVLIIGGISTLIWFISGRKW